MKNFAKKYGITIGLMVIALLSSATIGSNSASDGLSDAAGPYGGYVFDADFQAVQSSVSNKQDHAQILDELTLESEDLEHGDMLMKNGDDGHDHEPVPTTSFGRSLLFTEDAQSLEDLIHAFLPAAATISWGDIAGTLSSQPDLASALSGKVSLSGSYSDPSWITGLAWSKVSGAPAFLTSEVDGSISNEIEIPSQTGQSGKFLTTSGSAVSWATALTSEVDGSTTNEIELPTQSGNSGKMLQTNGTAASWVTNTQQEHWHNGTMRAASKKLTFAGTTTSGTVTFYMTNGGLVGGAALCTTTPDKVDVYVNDASNTYGWGHTVTNSNKNLNVTVNVRTFTSGNALLNLVGGVISVLTSTSLSPAPNGTPVLAEVTCI